MGKSGGKPPQSKKESGPPRKAGPTKKRTGLKTGHYELPSKCAAALRPYKRRKNRRAEARPLQGSAGDEELEGAGDDAEFDGEAGERLAVDLGVNRIVIEGLADDRIG